MSEDLKGPLVGCGDGETRVVDTAVLEARIEELKRENEALRKDDAEIVVTSEMESAGLDAFEFDYGDLPTQTVLRRVYIAMAKVARGHAK